MYVHNMFRIFYVNDSGLVLEWHEFFIPLLTYYLLSSPYLRNKLQFSQTFTV